MTNRPEVQLADVQLSNTEIYALSDAGGLGMVVLGIIGDHENPWIRHECCLRQRELIYTLSKLIDCRLIAVLSGTGFYKTTERGQAILDKLAKLAKAGTSLSPNR